MSNRDLAYRSAQSLTERDQAHYAALLHPEYVNHNAFAAPGKAGSVEVFFSGFVPALPDFRVTAEDVYEDGETLIGGFKSSGTLTHPLKGHAPTGQRIEMHSIDIWKVADGQLTEHWDELNTLEVFVQMGAATLHAPGSPEREQ